MNNVNLMGRLTHDPELRQTQSGIAVASFSLAVDRGYIDKESGRREVDFINIIAWKGRAEFVSKYFARGQMCAVTGRLQNRDWTDKDGNKRRASEVIADNIFFTESKKSRENSGGSKPESPADYYAREFEEMDDADLPF